jgi:hypothetical protein
MSDKAKHIEIAKKHKYFISFTFQVVENCPDKCKPEIFCTWIVTAAYYRAIHLIEAIFAQREKTHVFRGDEGEEDAKRNGLLRNLNLPQLREECKTLRRFALHAKYFPCDSPLDYDVVTQLDKTREWIVDGYLKRIEHLVANELHVNAEDLD